MAKIRIVKEKEKKATDYTFTDDILNLDVLTNSAPESNDAEDKKDGKGEQVYRLITDKTSSLDRIRYKSKMRRGRNMQGHSPVYE